MAPMRMGAIFLTATVGAVSGIVGTMLVLWVRAVWPATISDPAATLITGLLGAGVGLFAVLIAVWGVVSSRAIARRQSTMTHLATLEADGSSQKARRTFSKLVREEGSITHYAEKEHEGTENLGAIITVLNEFELISVGIQRGIIEPELFRRLNQSNVAFYWRHAQPFVVALRTRVERQSLYHEFEEMARWMSQNRVPRRRFWWAGII